MKFPLLLCTILLSTSAFAQSLAERFLDAQRILDSHGLLALPSGIETRPTMTEDPGEQTEAQRRLLILLSETREMSKVTFAATANPSEQDRSEICAKAIDINELMDGSDQLDGYGDLLADFQNLKESVDGVSQALLCDGPCEAFYNRRFHSMFVAYDGIRYPAELVINSTDGQYLGQNSGASGDLLELSCTDGGRTLRGKWSSNGHDGWFTYTLVDRATGDFKGQWGDYEGCIMNVRGQWNGHY